MHRKEDGGDTTARRSTEKRTRQEVGTLVPDLCNALGVLLIVSVFAMVLPLSIPRMLGYKVYNVTSSSMEPAIPLDCVVYVREVKPHDVTNDQIIAYMSEGKVTVHRVVMNRHVEEEYVTKGDANINEDASPVPYDYLLGLVALNVPALGVVVPLYESTMGKVYLVLTLAIGIMLNVLADRIRKARVRDAAAGRHNAMTANGQIVEMPRSGEWIRATIMCVLALIFLGSGAVVLYVNHQDDIAGEKYESAAKSYVSDNDFLVEGLDVAPIKVDFAALQAANPDIVGWIYCEGTPINYPVVHGSSNDDYLYHDYLGDYSVRGSIFMDYRSEPDFSDAETIIYGHNMSSGTMFAVLENWSEQQFYDEHPYMWLLTPEQDYKIILVSGHHASASSDVFSIRKEHDDAFKQYLTDVKSQSEFEPDESVVSTEEQDYVMLSTCSYLWEDARFVLHGTLVPVVTVEAIETVDATL